ncbi:MAG: T9SS type A sorting domain-containing protein, partial [Bacteroidota bacterium]
ANISFNLDGGHTTLHISDSSGRLVDTVFSRSLPAGAHQFSLNIGQYPAGIYFVRLSVGASVATRRLVRQ